MSDIFTVKKRREIMQKVRNKNSDIEILLRKFLFKNGLRFRVKNKIFGKPDIVFPSKKITIFCDGEFWHGKNYKNEKNKYSKFWVDKILVNMERDKSVNKILKTEGWSVLRFWESEILKNPEECVKKIKVFLK